jgi:hypothetical protein
LNEKKFLLLVFSLFTAASADSEDLAAIAALREQI